MAVECAGIAQKSGGSGEVLGIGLYMMIHMEVSTSDGDVS